MEEECKKLTEEITKKIIKNGEFGRRPSLKWICYIEVNFQNSVKEEKFKRGSLEIIIGDACSRYDRLLERCVESMHLGEKSLFSINSAQESKELQVAIELKSVKEKPYIFQWTDEEKLKESNYFKDKGTELFKENRIEEAFYKFSNALKLIITLDSVLENDDPGPEVNDLRVALYNNLARCQLHFNNYLFVVELCSNSININCSSKALYRRALAYIELKEYENAENDLIQLLKLEPKNKAAMEKYKEVRELDRVNRENYHLVLKKMFR